MSGPHRTPGRIARGIALWAVPLGGCSLVTTPVKVAGSVVEHAIDAVSPFDDDDPTKAPADEARPRASPAERTPAVFCGSCGERFTREARFCGMCGAAR